jgi:hypothetical protein
MPRLRPVANGRSKARSAGKILASRPGIGVNIRKLYDRHLTRGGRASPRAGKVFSKPTVYFRSLIRVGCGLRERQFARTRSLPVDPAACPCASTPVTASFPAFTSHLRQGSRRLRESPGSWRLGRLGFLWSGPSPCRRCYRRSAVSLPLFL